MCGIVGYTGSKNAVPILLDGLKRLEYRGYDSAGIAILGENDIIIDKVAGKVEMLSRKIEKKHYDSRTGIAHTRWATHGAPNDINAHPHLDCSGKLAVVHNGVIENYRSLKIYLEKKGHQFYTETDTEVLAHLFEEYYKGDLFEAVREALLNVEGTYGIAVIERDNPGRIIAARLGSPLVVAKGEAGEYFVASDVAAIVRFTKDVIFLEEGEIVAVDAREGIKLADIKDNRQKKVEVHTIDMDLTEIEKNGYPHFMLKEIHEQASTILNATRGRLDAENGDAILQGLADYKDFFRNVNRIILTACGTSWHAALIGEYLIESIAGIPVEVEYASEFRYRNPIIEEKTALFVISQSGETADTLAALREAKRKGARVFGICNVVGSTIARETDAGVYIHAGPEIGVASTKAFTSQVMVLVLIALYLGRRRDYSLSQGKNMVREIQSLPEKITELLQHEEDVKKIARYFRKAENALFLGRHINYPVALEGALKLKEISYIHAEGYPAAEMKHGPIALIDENMPCVVLANDDDIMYEKVITNIQEVKARNGKVIAVATKGNKKIKELVDDVLYVPFTVQALTPVINTIPLQLLAYFTAVERGCDVDQPRNLAKSVTVE
ncbi:MAG TPA: glutamine--fructose-6-phosphate transaminase (isomerizing) [Candidatus Mcinerneyibacteriales bacterium]|nr:glutamine--fructose-6-phosphate transaminase (isomerizing) [Candidatus Mcinerneyibacteriales bacterium]HPJ69381.1 glutamine--fructose-6-phosphate transaminase (isomerizing) [Candidatus Mcinerneyibacteriales bacterium]